MKLSIRLSIAMLLGGAAGACGPARSNPGTTPPPPGPVDGGAAAPAVATGAMARAAILAGDWAVPGGSVPVVFLRPGGPTSAIYGVAAGRIPIVWVITDTPADQPAGARSLQVDEYIGKISRRCIEPASHDSLDLTCSDGGTLAFRDNGSALDIESSTKTSGPDQVHLTAADPAPAPALEQADRGFASDTAARGADGWIAHYGDGAVEWHQLDLVDGKDAIRADIAPFLKDTALAWTPTASRMLVADGLAVTVGTFTATPRAGGGDVGRGTYLTLWRRGDKGWEVILDTGRSDD